MPSIKTNLYALTLSFLYVTDKMKKFCFYFIVHFLFLFMYFRNDQTNPINFEDIKSIRYCTNKAATTTTTKKKVNEKVKSS